MSRDTVLLIVDSLTRLLILLIMPYLVKLIQKYQLEQSVKKAVWAAEKMFHEKGMGEIKNIFVKEYILDKYKISAIELDVLIESRLKELDLLKKKLEVK